MKRICILLIAVSLFLIPPESQAEGFAIGAKASTLGITGEVMTSLHPKLNARAGVSYFSAQHEAEGDEFFYDADMKLSSYQILADWFPFGGAFFVSGGIVVNHEEGELDLSPMYDQQVGDAVYTDEVLGDLSAKVTFNGAAPYVGIGFGNALAGSPLGISLEIGGIYAGSPSVEMEASGLLAPSAEQGPIMEENLNWLEWYPVLSLGFTYQF